MRKAREDGLADIQKAKGEAKSEVQKAIGIKVTGSIRMNQGTTVIPIDQRKSGVLVALRVEAPYYDCRYLLAVAHAGNGESGFVREVSKIQVFDQFGKYGEPTFAVDKEGKLLVSNPKYPTEGVSAAYSVLLISD